MGIEKGFKCLVCSTEFNVDYYDDMSINKCPNCDQVYNYDEGLAIELTTKQLEFLKGLSK